jgi:hypothetical protein
MYADKEMMEYVSTSVFAVEKNFRRLFKEIDLYCKNLSEVRLLNASVDRLTESLRNVVHFNSNFIKLHGVIQQLHLYNENNEELNENILKLTKELVVFSNNLEYLKEKEEKLKHEQQRISARPARKLRKAGGLKRNKKSGSRTTRRISKKS